MSLPGGCAIFHKIERADCQGMALLAILEHPNSIQAATKAARRAPNAERRQRLPARMLDDRIDGDGDEGEVETGLRTLPKGQTLKNLDACAASLARLAHKSGGAVGGARPSPQCWAST